MRFSSFTYSDILALKVFLPKTSEQFSTKFSHMINTYIFFLIYLRQKKHENLITCQIFHPFNMFLLQSLFNFPFVDYCIGQGAVCHQFSSTYTASALPKKLLKVLDFKLGQVICFVIYADDLVVMAKEATVVLE